MQNQRIKLWEEHIVENINIHQRRIIELRLCQVKHFLFSNTKKGGNQRNDEQILRYIDVRFIFFVCFDSLLSISKLHYLMNR